MSILKQKIKDRSVTLGVVGLGYVGLPLAVEFGKRYPTVGFDIRAARVEELRRGHDSTLEVEPDLLAQARGRLEQPTPIALPARIGDRRRLRPPGAPKSGASA